MRRRRQQRRQERRRRRRRFVRDISLPDVALPFASPSFYHRRRRRRHRHRGHVAYILLPLRAQPLHIFHFFLYLFPTSICLSDLRHEKMVLASAAAARAFTNFEDLERTRKAGKEKEKKGEAEKTRLRLRRRRAFPYFEWEESTQFKFNPFLARAVESAFGRRKRRRRWRRRRAGLAAAVRG
jgi:hypothetical protein